jgi:hypothetical protein
MKIRRPSLLLAILSAVLFFTTPLATDFPLMVAALAPGAAVLIIVGMMMLQLIWVKAMVQETDRRSFDEIQRGLGIR